MLPKSFFSIKDISVKISLGECCVLMPFAEEFKKVHETIESAIEVEEICFHCIRADEFVHGGSAVEDILGAIGAYRLHLLSSLKQTLKIR